MEIGFIGLGIMGKPMVLNLLHATYEVKVYDIKSETLEEVVSNGATLASSPMDVAYESDIIFLALPNGSIVNEVLFGKDGITRTIKKGAIVIDMSSIAPKDSISFAKQLSKKGIYYLDAPISGGEPKAKDGSLSIMVGGDEGALNQVMTLLEVMGKEITYVGKSGSGSTTKLANQIIVNVTIAAIAEATVLCAKAGVDIEKMYQAIRSGLAGSTLLEAKMPMILERNFTAGGRIDINLKDLNNVFDTGNELNVSLPLTTNVIEMFTQLSNENKSSHDHIGLIQYYEKLANYIVE
ncbi:2-hydroxy-3-oxopropionate reductase [Pseudogracilibacillus sp. SO30301A]|uniref:2-hydroxy-3-oxopropionate reductase n=1 Tax=Pseudogracilibacillus sp. SO30301A TaxID=3098291 RepID=UPI00300E572C